MLRPLSEAGGFAARVEAAYRRLAGPFAQPPDLDLLLVAQSEWRREDAIVETADSYTAGITRHLEAARSLLDDSAKEQPSAQAARLERMAEAVKRAGPRIEDLRALYLQVRLLKRDVLLASSALDLGEVLFCKRSPPTWSHLVAQYFGWRQQSGGGLYVLEKPGRSLRTRDIVGMQLPPGSFLAPCLSFDARRIVFSFVACTEKERDPREFTVNEEGPDEAYFHIYEVGVDGAGLRQLTHGPYDDLMPAYLPDGGIAFCSTRRRAYSRCFGPEYSKRWHSYTIHRMEGDGKNIRILSVNDVSEWFPCVSNTGHLLFARWDYIDRDAVTHQNLWAMRPDGTNQMAVWGNATPRPHCMFQARQIPNSRKIVFVASAHHAVTGGPVCILDPAVDANSRPEAVTRVTPQPFPEAEGSPKEYYEAVWPLSERLFLASYSFKPLVFQGGRYNPRNALGIYLLDAGGNRELLYRDPKISSTTPIPLSARPAPPALPGTPPSDSPAEGEMILTDIYRGLGDVPRGSIKDLRIVQIFPKTTYVANSPRIGVAGEENARMILGVVPVEADGSARFLLPAQRPVLFQALDKDGFAYQTMRSTTSVQSGERTSCVGCHESRASAPPNGPAMALQRPPSTIEPSELGGEAFSYMRVVQPVLDKRCAPCHSGPKAKKGVDLTGTPERGFTRSYWSLCGDPADFPKSLAAGTALVPRFVQRNQVQVTPPGGRYGALGSRLMKMLRDGHNHVKLSDSEVRRLAAWIDCNAVFYGAYDPAAQAEQLAGKAIPAPKIQ
jgi:hypothetical protein